MSLEAWQHRRMLVPGRCHFCASAAPDPACRHPEAKLAALQLCGGCHAKLEPEVWKRCGLLLLASPACQEAGAPAAGWADPRR